MEIAAKMSDNTPKLISATSYSSCSYCSKTCSVWIKKAYNAKNGNQLECKEAENVEFTHRIVGSNKRECGRELE